MVVSALGYLSTCALAALGMHLAWSLLTPWLAALVSAVLALLIAREMRGLECLVHEGSQVLDVAIGVVMWAIAISLVLHRPG